MDREDQVTRKPKTRTVTRDLQVQVSSCHKLLNHNCTPVLVRRTFTVSPTAIWDSQGKITALILCAKSIV